MTPEERAQRVVGDLQTLGELYEPTPNTVTKLIAQAIIEAVAETAAERDRLKESNAELMEALARIKASGSCYCPRDMDGNRLLGSKCSICAEATLAKHEAGET